MRSLVILVATFLISTTASAQCCAGGSGSPIAGGVSQGVLQDRQMEINTNFQTIHTDKFLERDHSAEKTFDKYNSNYLYTRLAYGITKDFTISVESGYYLNKTQVGLDKSDTISSKGIGDLVIFPRYDIYNHTEEETRTEITLGMGYKIPMGSYNDSLKQVVSFTGETYYITKPVAVQPTSGSHDFIFYAFFFRGYTEKKFRIFANALYVKKGWNPIGEKQGNYASLGLFAGKTFFENLGVTLQLKGELIQKMQYNSDLFLIGKYNYDVESTGSRKVLLVPQLSYTFKAFTIYALGEFPLYQYVNKLQIASQYAFTTGLTYRFYTRKAD